MSQSLSEVAYESAKDEYVDSTVYKKFSEMQFSRNQEFNRSLAELAEMKRRYYEFWSRYCPEKRIGVSSLRVHFIVVLRLILGLTFAVRYLERNEVKVIKKYKQVAHLVPEQDRRRLEEIIADEEEHERKFSEQFEEPHIK